MEDREKLEHLREAVRVGMADLDAGRYRTFDDPDALRCHVMTLMRQARVRRDKAAG